MNVRCQLSMSSIFASTPASFILKVKKKKKKKKSRPTDPPSEKWLVDNQTIYFFWPNGVHLIMEVAPPPLNKSTDLCSSQWMKGHKVWLKPKALWAYKHAARWKTCCWGIFCSRFHQILSPLALELILEMVFWTNLMLDLICTWLEKTRRFCRQVNKKISSCFWTASTCVQRRSLGWCSRLTYMETVNWIHVG